jgi:hypothetical protein
MATNVTLIQHYREYVNDTNIDNVKVIHTNVRNGVETGNRTGGETGNRIGDRNGDKTDFVNVVELIETPNRSIAR